MQYIPLTLPHKHKLSGIGLVPLPDIAVREFRPFRAASVAHRRMGGTVEGGAAPLNNHALAAKAPAWRKGACRNS
jgi:hypothetical protein